MSSVINNKDVTFEHVGSTAVPGLGGKGIIDICIAVDKSKLQEISSRVQQRGYEFKPKASFEHRLFHQIDLPDEKGGARRYHIHVIDINSSNYKEMIAFRDYLRTHPEDMKKYDEIKKEAAQKATEDKETYMAIKQPVIDEILTKALLNSN